MGKLPMLIAVAGFAICTAQAGTITNTFDLGQTPPPGEPGPTAPASIGPANGVHALGVVFTFTENGLPSTAATYGYDATTFGLDPITGGTIFGPADGTLTLNLDFPSTFVSFDFALGPGTADSNAQVTVGGVPTDFGTTTGGMGGLFSIGSAFLVLSGPSTPVVITFNNFISGADFAIDNLSYDPPSGGPVPEPASPTLLCAGALLLLGMLRFRRPALK